MSQTSYDPSKPMFSGMASEIPDSVPTTDDTSSGGVVLLSSKSKGDACKLLSYILLVYGESRSIWADIRIYWKLPPNDIHQKCRISWKKMSRLSNYMIKNVNRSVAEYLLKIQNIVNNWLIQLIISIGRMRVIISYRYLCWLWKRMERRQMWPFIGIKWVWIHSYNNYSLDLTTKK